ncbi:MAG: enoyl-CoA hydratase/isomerase family protein [Microthrixaceae bacterium]|nr:enoyl-CoA hydratase/isomerase family protein [Microthrixaceae bacterium]
MLLNRPAKRNELSTALLRELAAVARWFDSVSEVRAVVISGAGDHFSAGADLEAFSGPAAAKELVMTCRPFDAAEARSR